MVAVVVAASAVAAMSATAAPSRVHLIVTPELVFRGQYVLLHGNAGSCPVGDTVFLISHAFVRRHTFAGIPAVLAKVTSGGHFRVRTRIPRSTHSGLYHIAARCGGGNLGVSATIHVVA